MLQLEQSEKRLQKELRETESLKYKLTNTSELLSETKSTLQNLKTEHEQLVRNNQKAQERLTKFETVFNECVQSQVIHIEQQYSDLEAQLNKANQTVVNKNLEILDVNDELDK